MDKVISKYLNEVEAAIEASLTKLGSSTLADAMRYTTSLGGKRIRPILTLAAADIYGDYKSAMDCAVAIEMIHTMSLIHDDLPAMDNDDYRRGKLTNHKVFGEAQAVLAGDSLTVYAFEVIADSQALSDKAKVGCMKILADYSGIGGMMGGQSLDIIHENKLAESKDFEILKEIHFKKTTKLFQAALLMGAVANGADNTAKHALEEFGAKVGLAFQVQDDILDETSTFEATGKATKKDALKGKLTYPKVFGLERSRQMRDEYLREALGIIRDADRLGELHDIAIFMVERDK